MPVTSESTQEELITEIQRLTKKARDIQAKFDTGKNKGYDAAIGLQKLKRDISEIRARLSAFKLIEHPNPETLPPFYKRTRNEVREFMGLPPIDGADNEYL